MKFSSLIQIKWAWQKHRQRRKCSAVIYLYNSLNKGRLLDSLYKRKCLRLIPTLVVLTFGEISKQLDKQNLYNGGFRIANVHRPGSIQFGLLFNFKNVMKYLIDISVMKLRAKILSKKCKSENPDVRVGSGRKYSNTT